MVEVNDRFNDRWRVYVVRVTWHVLATSLHRWI